MIFMYAELVCKSVCVCVCVCVSCGKYAHDTTDLFFDVFMGFMLVETGIECFGCIRDIYFIIPETSLAFSW